MFDSDMTWYQQILAFIFIGSILCLLGIVIAGILYLCYLHPVLLLIFVPVVTEILLIISLKNTNHKESE